MAFKKILVVEDEFIVARDIQVSLQALGYEVSEPVKTGEAAIEQARKTRPDLVLMDVLLPGAIDGIAAAAHIHDELEIPVVYLTAHADEEVLRRAQATEPFGYLIKPFRRLELRSTIEMALLNHKIYKDLKESREWLSVTFSSIGDAVIATDEKGRVRFMNPIAQAVTGWSDHDAKGRPLNEVYNTVKETTRTRLGLTAAHFARRPSESASNNISVALIAKHGRKRIVESNTAPIRDAEDNVIGQVLVFRDITERKQAEERLRLLSEAVEQSSEGLAVVDLDGRVVFLNKAFAEMHGYSQAQVVGKHLSVFHSPEQMEQVKEANRHLTAQDMFTGEIWHARADGDVFPGLMHNSVLRDHDGTPIGLIGTLRDISDIKKTEEELRRSHEALEAYSSSLEAKVAERTRDLEESRLELKRYSESLEKANEALKLVVEGIEEQKRGLEKKIAQNLDLTVKPIVDQLKTQDLSETESFLLQSLEFNLNNILSSFGFSTIKQGHQLTPKEMRICEMIRSGLSSKQIAKIMGISSQTVLVHRKNIRKKLNIDKSRKNLASFLKAQQV